MRRYIFLVVFTILTALQLTAQDFYTRYNALDSLPERAKLVYGNIEKPFWRDHALFYESRTPQGVKYYRLQAEENRLEEVPLSAELSQPDRKDKKQKDVFLSPDGQYEAFLRDSNVWLREIASGKVSRLSWDGTDHAFYERLYWSPDSKKIAAIKKLDTPMRKIPLIESAPKDQKQPVLHWRDYYKPGDYIPIYLPALFDAATAKQLPIDVKPFENQYYLEFERWKTNSSAFTFSFNQRGHQLYQVVDVCAESGKAKVIVDERADTFIDYNRVYLRYVDNDESLIWASERDGWNHLYLIDAVTGAVKQQLTRGKWVVRNVLDVNEKQGYLLISGNGRNPGEDPYNMHYYKIYYKGEKTGRIEELTPEAGHHTVLFDKDFTYFLDTYSAPDRAPENAVKKVSDGSVLRDFGQADISRLLETGWKKPEVFMAKGRDGKTDIWGNIYRPSHFDPKKKYPVVEYIYAGPHDAFVDKHFKVYDRYLKLAEMGFIVVTIDGMGTANRSKAFHDVCWRNLKDSGYPDRILWIKAAAKKYKYMDVSNGVGVYGYSAGGQSTVAALLFFGDFYKVGVSLCGCHDNRMDKIWWNEQWMGYPAGEWYSESSNVDNAHRLNGKLLLINGELDDNVDPASTLQVVDALVKANKHFEQLYLPGYGHNLGDKYVTGRVYEFFWRNLGYLEQKSASRRENP